MHTKSRLLHLLSIVAILATILSSVNLPTASAQGRDPIQRERNAETGKVNFIGAASGASVSFSQAMGALPGATRPADPAMALARRFAPEFGLRDPQRDLSVMQTNPGEQGRLTVKYQQMYQGIPVMGGELIVNTNQNGDLYSMNGEVAQDLSLSTQPTITAEQAKATALQAMAKWNETTVEAFVATEPELWIFDESLLQPSARPTELVWRMEVTSADGSLPIRELMLINAQTGNPDFHFNQVDTSWHVQSSAGLIQDQEPTPTALPTETPLTTETPFFEEKRVLSEEESDSTAVSVSSSTVPDITTPSGTTRYVATTGSDTSDCSSRSAPCATISRAIENSLENDTILVEMGTYKGNILQNYVVYLGTTPGLKIIGGWNSDFTSTIGMSTIDGQGSQIGIGVSASGIKLQRLNIQNSAYGIENTGELTIHQVSITKNHFGGVLNRIANNGPIASLVVLNSTINNNRGQGGAGINNNGGTVTINNSTISENATNWPTASGGGIWTQGGTVTLSNTILAKNTAPSSPNCVLYPYNTPGLLISGGNNIIDNTAGCSITAAAGDKFNVDPKLSSFLDSAGYQPLQGTSPAINAGNIATCEAIDQRDVPRLNDGKCDIGAYEYKTPLTAARLAVVHSEPLRTPIGSSFPKGLDVAVLDSYGSPINGIPVQFAAPVDGPSARFNGAATLSMVTDVNGFARTPLPQANDQYGDYFVTVSSGILDPITLPLHNGAWLVSSSSGNDNNDCLSKASPCASLSGVLGKTTFQSGEHIWIAAGTYDTYGNIYTLNKGPRIKGGWNADFSAAGGASLLNGAYSITAPTEFREVIFSSRIENLSNLLIEASSFYQGSIWNKVYGNLTLRNVTITGGQGTALVNDGGTARIVNSTITNNHGVIVGGIDNSSGVVILKDSILAGNTADYEQTYASPDCKGAFVSEKNNIVGLVVAPDPIYGGYVCTGNWSSTEDILGLTFDRPLPIDEILDPVITQHPVLGQYYHKLVFGSQAIDNGNNSSCLPTDQIGVSRPIGNACDIGASEFVPQPIMTKLSGSDQVAPINASFAEPLKVFVRDGTGHPAVGVSVTFTGPSNGPTLDFAGEQSFTTTVLSDAYGVAVSPNFNANGLAGVYSVLASAPGFSDIISFTLTNSQTWYISTTGSNSNDCASPNTPCATLTGLLAKGTILHGDDVLMARGTYDDPSRITINKSLDIYGGWDAGFISQSGASVLQDTLEIVTTRDVSVHQLTIENTPYYGIVSAARLLVENTSIRNNQRGGIENDGELTVINSTITGNGWSQSNWTEGGIFNDGNGSGASATIANSTITNNRGGGVRNYYDNPRIEIANTIIAGNPVVDRPPDFIDCSGEFLSLGGNIIGNVGDSRVPSCSANWSETDLVGYSLFSENGQFLEDRSVDAKLDAVQDSGGQVWVHSPILGSPAINGGVSYKCPSTDQRGISRPQGGSCDIGAYEYVFNADPNTMLLRTFDSAHSWDLPGTLVCDQTDLDCMLGDEEAKAAHHFAAGIYDFYAEHFSRNSIDNNGLELISSVNYGEGYQNAFWNGYMTVYGDGYGFAKADDVVAHELTHGVTQYESNLFYYYQSGAINESFSDLWGEYYDQTNGQGNDTTAVRWLVGEETGVPGGAFRSMSNPPQFGDPDKMTSTLYNKKPYYDVQWDNGGVHSNSGVNNKAVYLMVDGGTFNSKTVTALGWEKTGAIYYEAQTNLLASGADYSDLYYALQQACTNMLGQHGITAADCIEVKDALDAVQMNSQPVTNFNPDAPVCPAGMTTAPSLSLYYEDFESGMDGWSIEREWYLDSVMASSASNHMSGLDIVGNTDSLLRLPSNINIPVDSTSFLHFKHSFAFEYHATSFYDGGVLEYSVDNGNHWLDAKPLFSAGRGYGGSVYNYPIGYGDYNSALHGRSAFVGDSHGYVSSRYNLSSLAGKAVQFRWRLATDVSYGYHGWSVDDIQIYGCTGTPSIPALQMPLNNALSTNLYPVLEWSDVSSSLSYYQVQLDDEQGFNEPIINANTGTTSRYEAVTPLTPGKTYFWRVRALNGIDSSLGWSRVWSLRTAFAPPILLSPNTGYQTFSLRPTFDWEDVGAGVTGYTIQFSTSSAFTRIVRTGNVIASTYTPTTNLPKGLLYWRVLAKGTYGPSAWSEVRSFQGPNPPLAPRLTAPANGALSTSYTPLLKWNPVVMPVGAAPFAYYQLQLDDNSDFSSPLVEETGLTNRLLTQYQYPLDPAVRPPLAPNTTYYWRVRAVTQLMVDGVHETSPWSAARNFRTVIQPPSLNLPENALTAVSRLPLLDWSDVTSNSGYTLQIWRAGTTPITVNTAVNVSQYQFLTGLLPNTTYFWRVQTKAGNGPSLWSETFSFTTGP